MEERPERPTAGPGAAPAAPASWQDRFDALVAPARYEWRAPACAEATAVVARLGQVSLLSVAAGPVRVHRTPRLVTGAPVHRVALAVQGPGAATLTQDGRSAALHPGDLAFVDPRRAFSLEQRQPFGMLLLVLPERLLGLSAERAAGITGRAVGRENGTAMLLAPFLEQLPHTARQVPSAVAELLAGSAVEALALLADEALPQDDVPPGDSRHHLVTLVRRYIDENLADPGLSPERIAAVHHISVRYLHRLFEGEGVTVGRLIRQRRVEECGGELARRGRASPTISAVAQRWGFQSPAHFSRTFKEVFGVPPRQWRLTGLPVLPGPRGPALPPVAAGGVRRAVPVTETETADQALFPLQPVT
ncbi:helix-turn-helix domain-containing protein [Streptomyces sp. NPDC002644]